MRVCTADGLACCSNGPVPCSPSTRLVSARSRQQKLGDQQNCASYKPSHEDHAAGSSLVTLVISTRNAHDYKSGAHSPQAFLALAPAFLLSSLLHLLRTCSQ
eukprot:1158635-Pelagomonas_calceolata.AAC.5